MTPPREGAERAVLRAGAARAARSEIGLCADDYGLTRAIDRGILRLAARGRLSDVSCIVNSSGWATQAMVLHDLPVRVGLHLNLTEGQALSPALRRRWPRLPSLPRLIAQAHLGALDIAALGDEIRAQLNAFEQAFGQAPMHLDGHQHVHHLPGLRSLVQALLAQRPWLRVRCTARPEGPGFAVKRALIAGTGGRALGALLQATGRARNTRLRGVYDFKHRDYRSLMQGWLQGLPPQGTLIFCHPGHAEAGDAIGPARERELAYLDSPAFDDDLAAAGAVLEPLNRQTTNAG